MRTADFARACHVGKGQKYALKAPPPRACPKERRGATRLAGLPAGRGLLYTFSALRRVSVETRAVTGPAAGSGC